MTERMFPLMQPQIEVARSLLLKPNISFSGLKETGSVGVHFEKCQNNMVLHTVKLAGVSVWLFLGDFFEDVVTGGRKHLERLRLSPA